MEFKNQIKHSSYTTETQLTELTYYSYNQILCYADTLQCDKLLGAQQVLNKYFNEC